jgi:hypothetical protein
LVSGSTASIAPDLRDPLQESIFDDISLDDMIKVLKDTTGKEDLTAPELS